jgi:hypothetical protein
VTASSLTENIRGREWAAIYRDLRAGLGAYGRENPFGEGDFLVVDDDYGSSQHKIECTSPTFFTSAVVGATQAILSNYSPQWEVIFVATGGESGSAVYVVSADQCTLAT